MFMIASKGITLEKKTFNLSGAEWRINQSFGMEKRRSRTLLDANWTFTLTAIDNKQRLDVGKSDLVELEGSWKSFVWHVLDFLPF